jgi:hypothetical protein
MIVTKKALPRRTFLRGIGAAISLPLLDAMVPALTPQAKTAAAPIPRLGFVYTPNGYLRKYWVPKGTGADWEVTRALQALAPFRDHITLVSGLAQRQADAMGDPPGPHSRASGAWLTGVHVKRTEGADVRAGKSADQIAADVLGRDTPLPSIEIATEQNDKLIGNCEAGYSCVYQNTVSWRDAATPLPMETNPRVVFERLFGEGGSPAEEREELRRSRSILDAVNDRIAQLQKALGPIDRQRLDQYLESVRDIEARIERAEARTDDLALALPERPIDIPGAFEDHVKMMFDLQALAYQGDVTRVITFQLAREQSSRAYPLLGISGGHHAISHHSGDPEKIEQKAKIDAHHVQLLAYYVEKLKATPDGDGSLLDHVLVLYGASLGDGNAHDCWDLPNIVVGAAGGRLKPGRHIAFNMRDYTPMCNMLVSMLGMVAVPIEKLGDSTGPLRELSEL